MTAKFRLEDEEVAGTGHNFIGVAGVALGNRQLVRIGAAGTLLRADAGAVGTLPAMGITLAAAALGQNVLVLLKGWVGLSTWTWTAGGRLYATDVAGAIGQATGTVIQEVGVAYSATQIWFDPHAIDTAGAGGGLGGDPDFIAAPNPDSYVGDHSAMRLQDGQDITIRMDYLLPTDYLLASWQVDALIIPGGTGNMRIGITTDYGAICAGEQYDTHDEVQVAGEVAVTDGEIECVTLTSSITAAAALDLVGMAFTRYGSHANDTVNADCYFIGVVIRRP